MTAAARRGDPPPPRAAGNNPKLAAQTAHRIEDDIIAAQWPVGLVFGSEAQLMQRYGVSRAVLREAIRLVEHHGLARTRRGPSGGLIVQEPDVAAVISAVVVYLDHVGTSVDDLMFARRLLEPLAAAMAAEHITEDGIAELRAIAERGAGDGEGRVLSGEDMRVHFAIAARSGNAALALFVDILLELTRFYATTQSRITRGDAEQAANGMTRAHASLVSAIVAGDSAAARYRLDSHLQAVQDFLRAHRRKRRSAGRAVRPEEAGDHTDKLAEVIARDVRADIAQRGLPVGSVIGSEDELRERYGVSRAALREAVRLLEHHSIASMRRGPGGGLVVARPDPAASIEAAALYLRYRRAKATDLRPVREALEFGILDLLTTDLPTKPAVRRRLEDLLAAPDSAELDDIIVRLNEFHPALAQLAGNPVLELLLRIVLSLWDRYGEPPPQALPVSRLQLAETAMTAHRKIATAVLDGDYALARHRMSRHLGGITAVTDS